MLAKEIEDRIQMAGVQVIEARISHCAYATEIAHSMLMRQQATAVVAARTKIVDGSVGMCEMALDKIAQRKIVEFTELQKAQLISNLLIVLCSEHSAQPVVNMTNEGSKGIRS